MDATIRTRNLHVALWIRNYVKTTGKYQPPFTITANIINLVASISKRIGRLTVLNDPQALRLRRVNRVRTIQGSLAIEGNTLSETQITAILEGKRVIAPPREVHEARNAITAYDQFQRWQPAVEADLLEAHRTLMSGLIDNAGNFRDSGVGAPVANPDSRALEPFVC